MASHRPREILVAEIVSTVQDHNRRASRAGIIDIWRKSYQVYATLQLEASETGKLEAELSPAADNLAMANCCLIVRDHVIGIKYLPYYRK